MVSIECYGVGTGYNSSTGCPTGVKSTFEYNEKIWASHCWGGLSGGENFIIIWDRKISGNWNTETFHEWTNPGYSSAYQYAWIQNYPSGEWRVRFNISGGGTYTSYFTLKSIPTYQFYDVSGTPTGAEIWEGSKFIGNAPMVFHLSYTSHYLTFKKTGYESKTVQVGTKPGGEIIYVSYYLNPIIPYIPPEWRYLFPSDEILAIPSTTWIGFVTNPSGASLAVDGVGVGQTNKSIGRDPNSSHIVQFQKEGYLPMSATIIWPSSGYADIYIQNLIPSFLSIRETIGWDANVPDHGAVTHPFYLFSLYGTNTNNTIGGFQIKRIGYIRIITPSMSRLDNITTSNVSGDDCLTIIAENFDGSTISGVYDWRIDTIQELLER